MAENKFNSTVAALFTGMDSVVSSKTVVGDAIHIGETIILPLVDVSFAVGAGAYNEEKKEKGLSFLENVLENEEIDSDVKVKILEDIERIKETYGYPYKKDRRYKALYVDVYGNKKN